MKNARFVRINEKDFERGRWGTGATLGSAQTRLRVFDP